MQFTTWRTAKLRYYNSLFISFMYFSRHLFGGVFFNALFLPHSLVHSSESLDITSSFFSYFCFFVCFKGVPIKNVQCELSYHHNQARKSFCMRPWKRFKPKSNREKKRRRQHFPALDIQTYHTHRVTNTLAHRQSCAFTVSNTHVGPICFCLLFIWLVFIIKCIPFSHSKWLMIL